MHTFENVAAGETVNVRIRTREKEFRVDEIVITNRVRLRPTGIVSKILSPDEADVTKLESTYTLPPAINQPHPRLLFTKDDIEAIKANFSNEENENAYRQYLEFLNADINDGNLPDQSSNYSASVQETIFALAFDYAINGNEEHGRAAVEAAMNYFKTISWPTSGTVYGYKGYTMFISAIVYDWCYDLMSDKEREFLVGSCEAMSADNEIGFPPNKQGSVTGHGTEFQYLRDWVALAVATYDEYPDIYNYVVGRVYDDYAPVRKYYYNSKTHHQGTGYAFTRYAADMMCDYILSKIGQKNVFGENIGDVFASLINLRRPDGQFIRIGDTFDDGFGMWTRDAAAAFLAANIYKNPLYKRAYAISSPILDGQSSGYSSISPVVCLRTAL